MTPERQISRRRFLKSAGLGAVGAIGTFAYGDLTSSKVRLEQKELKLPRWDADGFKVAVITDLHLDYPEAVLRTQWAISQLAALQPDVFVIVGDFLTSAAPQNLENVRTALRYLDQVKCPVFATLGNHDYWVGYFDLVTQAITSANLRLLRNEVVDLNGVAIAGIDDDIAYKARPELIAEAKKPKSTIALFHEPDSVKDVSTDLSLQISGHSHGGQICMPGGISVHTPRGAKKYIAGFYPDAKVPLYVSRGVGTTGPNWRLFCPPEATLLTLRGS
ncbi:MAG: metallophosphoesterase [Armatimonadetes bacterium]|nr:metallophosphoesterase [Armatimonadota bacterium]